VVARLLACCTPVRLRLLLSDMPAPTRSSCSSGTNACNSWLSAPNVRSCGNPCMCQTPLTQPTTTRRPGTNTWLGSDPNVLAIDIPRDCPPTSASSPRTPDFPLRVKAPQSIMPVSPGRSNADSPRRSVNVPPLSCLPMKNMVVPCPVCDASLFVTTLISPVGSPGNAPKYSTVTNSRLSVSLLPYL
jgi:hypothetical protein